MNQQSEGRRVRVSPGTVFGVLALIVALAAPAHAAVQSIAAGTVGTAQLKDGAVTTPKIDNDAVTGPKIRNGTIGLGDLAASARPQLPRWRGSDSDATVQLPAGRWRTILALSLPAGQWLVSAKGVAYTHEAEVICDLFAAGRAWDRTVVLHEVSGDEIATGYTPMSLEQRVVLSKASFAQLRCLSGSGTQMVLETKLNAVQVRS